MIASLLVCISVLSMLLVFIFCMSCIIDVLREIRNELAIFNSRLDNINVHIRKGDDNVGDVEPCKQNAE